MEENKELKEEKMVSDEEKSETREEKIVSDEEKSEPDYKQMLHELKEKYWKKIGEMETLNDKYLRLNAEFDNFRKRTIREKEEIQKTSNERIILEMLTVLDNFERAMPLDEGLLIIYNDLNNKLEKYGVSLIECDIDDIFNSDEHEAISTMELLNKEPNTIIDIVEKGYKLNDKVIRYTKVITSK